jgi:sirohydrochlorin ferrochelatase
MNVGRDRVVLLVDNGSLEPASILQLRAIALALETRLGVPVVPTSVAHSANVSLEKLNGRPAELFEAGLDRRIAEGVDEFVIVPLFIGPSHAITRHLPAVVAERKKQYDRLKFFGALPLYSAGDDRLARILTEHVHAEMGAGQKVRVAVVDHGSPNRAVTQVRDEVTSQVKAMLGESVADVAACSMERRPGAEYSFNEPLLSALLASPDWSRGPTVVAMMFLAAGRHAGVGGDVAEICREAVGEGPAVRITQLLGSHPLLLDILEDRALAAIPIG